MPNENNKSILKELEYLKKNHPYAFENLDKLMHDVYKNSLIHESEQFYYGKCEGYKKYRIPDEEKARFAKEFGFPYYYSNEYYLLDKDYFEYAAIYSVDKWGTVRKKQHMFTLADIEKIVFYYSVLTNECVKEVI